MGGDNFWPTMRKAYMTAFTLIGVLAVAVVVLEVAFFGLKALIF